MCVVGWMAPSRASGPHCLLCKDNPSHHFLWSSCCNTSQAIRNTPLLWQFSIYLFISEKRGSCCRVTCFSVINRYHQYMPSCATFLFHGVFRFYISVNVLPSLQKNYFYNQISVEFILSLKYSFTRFIIQFAINVGNKFQESESSNFFFTTLIHISTYSPCTFTRPAPVVQSRPKMMCCKAVGPFWMLR